MSGHEHVHEPERVSASIHELSSTNASITNDTMLSVVLTSVCATCGPRAAHAARLLMPTPAMPANSTAPNRPINAVSTKPASGSAAKVISICYMRSREALR